MIQVHKVKKSFNDIKAINSLSFEIKKGEVVGLLGPNGAGKTTMMKMLIGYLLPDAGYIKIKGQNIKQNTEEIRKIIGYMPENNPIYKDMLVGELLRYILELHRVKKSEWDQKIDKVVKSVGIKEVFYRPISELSKGYRQRVGLAQALVHEPEILILDEPTEGLDPNQRAGIRDLIKKIGEEKTVIISTHVLQEVAAMCERVLIINKGTLVADSTPDDLINSKKGKNKVIASFEGKDVKNQIEKIKGVEKVSIIEDKKPIIELEILYNGDNQFFKDISEAIAKNQWVVYKLQKKTESLEEVFYQITK